MFSSKLEWAPYFRLLKTFIFKLNRFGHHSSVLVGGKVENKQGDGAKMVTKCICKMLAGFKFAEVNDAVEEIVKIH